MRTAQSGDTVRVHYTGTLDDGSEFDSSAGREPLEFTVGSGQVIAGFDEAVTGLEVGTSRRVTIAPENAYGKHDADLMFAVDRDRLPDGLDPVLGEQLHIGQPDGGVIAVTVAEMSDDQLVLDANHPLAGQALTFDITLEEIA